MALHSSLSHPEFLFRLIPAGFVAIFQSVYPDPPPPCRTGGSPGERFSASGKDGDGTEGAPAGIMQEVTNTPASQIGPSGTPGDQGPKDTAEPGRRLPMRNPEVRSG
jgi:hypothetical protein